MVMKLLVWICIRFALDSVLKRHTHTYKNWFKLLTWVVRTVGVVFLLWALSQQSHSNSKSIFEKWWKACRSRIIDSAYLWLFPPKDPPQLAIFDWNGFIFGFVTSWKWCLVSFLSFIFYHLDERNKIKYRFCFSVFIGYVCSISMCVCVCVCVRIVTYGQRKKFLSEITRKRRKMDYH